MRDPNAPSIGGRIGNADYSSRFESSGPSRPVFRSAFSKNELDGSNLLATTGPGGSAAPATASTTGSGITATNSAKQSAPLLQTSTGYRAGAPSPGNYSKMGSMAGGGPMAIASIVADNIDKTASSAMAMQRTKDSMANINEWATTQTQPGIHAKLHADMRAAEAQKQLEWSANASELGGALFGPLGKVAGHYIGQATAPSANLDFRTANSPYGKVNPQDPEVVSTLSSSHNDGQSNAI